MSTIFAGVVGFGRALTPRAWLIIAVAAAAAWILILTYLGGRSDGAHDRDTRTERAQAQTQRRADRANDQSAVERTNDGRTVQDLEQDLTHALRPLPDAPPSARRRALACVRLRNDPDADPVAVAARCGPEG